MRPRFAALGQEPSFDNGVENLDSGGKHPDAKPWKGLGSGVFEVVSDLEARTFRAVYVVRLERAIYVLHCFQKKSPSGIRTAKTDVKLIERRLKAARDDYEVRYAQTNSKR